MSKEEFFQAWMAAVRKLDTDWMLKISLTMQGLFKIHVSSLANKMCFRSHIPEFKEAAASALHVVAETLLHPSTLSFTTGAPLLTAVATDMKTMDTEKRCVKMSQIRKVCCLLIQTLGANPVMMDINGNTPCHSAAKANNHKFLKVMYAMGGMKVFLNKNIFMQPPVTLAVKNRKSLSFLLKICPEWATNTVDYDHDKVSCKTNMTIAHICVLLDDAASLQICKHFNTSLLEKLGVDLHRFSIQFNSTKCKEMLQKHWKVQSIENRTNEQDLVFSFQDLSLTTDKEQKPMT